MLAAFCAHAFGKDVDVRYLKCEVKSKNLTSTTALNDLVVSPITESTFALVLSETQGQSTYNTYLHLNLNLVNDNLKVSTQVEHSSIQKVYNELNNKYSVNVEIKSRLNPNQNMLVNVTCLPSESEYLLIPIGNYDPSAFNTTQNVPETISSIVNHLSDGRFKPQQFSSVSEFIASDFCLIGDANETLEDLKSESVRAPNFWRYRILDTAKKILPTGLRTEKNSVKWFQGYETAACVKWHSEVYVDENGQEQSSTVCDQYKIKQEKPLALTIRACDK
jgi:hypothetical protein